MLFYPVEYDQPLFRPPAEANSVIIQATIGCSWNKCAFCEMYTSKKFKIKEISEIESDIKAFANFFPSYKKFFLADGNAFILSHDKLIRIINQINSSFTNIQRISAYALPSDILKKTDKELKSLKKSGLKLLYIGIETGDDELLKLINKGETYQSTLDGIKKVHDAGIDTSIMILNGLGGKKYSKQHAIRSSEIVNQLSPKYLSVLTLSFPFGEKHYIKRFMGEYQPMNSADLLNELKLFIENTEVQDTIFRTDHISNNIILKGILPRNKEDFITTINRALHYKIKGKRTTNKL